MTNIETQQKKTAPLARVIFPKAKSNYLLSVLVDTTGSFMFLFGLTWTTSFSNGGPITNFPAAIANINVLNAFWTAIWIYALAWTWKKLFAGQVAALGPIVEAIQQKQTWPKTFITVGMMLGGGILGSYVVYSMTMSMGNWVEGSSTLSAPTYSIDGWFWKGNNPIVVETAWYAVLQMFINMIGTVFSWRMLARAFNSEKSDRPSHIATWILLTTVLWAVLGKFNCIMIFPVRTISPAVIALIFNGGNVLIPTITMVTGQLIVALVLFYLYKRRKLT